MGEAGEEEGTRCQDKNTLELTLGSKVRLGRTCLKKSGDSELRDL